MTAKVPQSIDIEFRGAQLRLAPSHELYMQIEERIAFGRLATVFSAAARGSGADVPMSHVSWVVYCALRHAGARIETPLDAHQAVLSNEINWGALLGSLIAAYYGALPQKAAVDKELSAAKKPKARARNSRR